MFRSIHSKLLVVAVGAMGAGALHAQTAARTAQTDPRWFPWLGCWTSDSAAAGAATGGVACIVPVAGSSAVEQISIVDGRVIARHRIDASGRALAIDNQGCRGTQAGDWGHNGRRVFLRAVYTCTTGVSGSSESIYSLSSTGEWIKAEGVRGGQNSSPLVSVDRLRDAGIPSGLPHDAGAALASSRLAIATSRAAAAAALSTDDVIEATRRVDPLLVASWIAETGQRFSLTGQQLAALGSANVPSVVLQAMMGNPVNAQAEYGESTQAPPAYHGSAISSAYAEQPMVVQVPVPVYQPYYDQAYAEQPYYDAASGYYPPYPYGLPVFFGYAAFAHRFPFGRSPFGVQHPFRQGQRPLVGVRTPVTAPVGVRATPQQPVSRGPAGGRRP